jgi:WD40 repeat protein
MTTTRRSFLGMSLLAAGCAAVSPEQRDAISLREVRRFAAPPPALRVLQSWHGDLVAISGTLGYHLVVHSISRGAITFDLEALSSNDSVCFTTDDRFLIVPHRISSSEQTVFHVFDPHRGTLVHTVEGDRPGRRNNAMKFARASPDGRYLVVLQDGGRELALFNMRWEMEARVSTGLRGARALAISDKGDQAAIASLRTIQFWSLPDLRLIGSREAHSGWVPAMTYSGPDSLLIGADPTSGPTGRPAMTEDNAHLVKIIDAPPGDRVQQFATPTSNIGSVAYYEPAGLIFASFWRRFEIWNQAGAVVASRSVEEQTTPCLTTGPRRDTLFVGVGNVVRQFQILQ